MWAPPLANAGAASAQGSAEHADEAGPAETALRGHFGHVGDLAEAALEGGCNNNCDRLGAAGAGQGGKNAQRSYQRNARCRLTSTALVLGRLNSDPAASLPRVA